MPPSPPLRLYNVCLRERENAKCYDFFLFLFTLTFLPDRDFSENYDGRIYDELSVSRFIADEKRSRSAVYYVRRNKVERVGEN